MYNTKIICTYNTPEVFLESDNINEDEKEFIRNIIYRQEILDILGLEEFDEIEINKAICDLYELIKEHKDLQLCMIKIAKNFFSSDEKYGLILLLAYDYMYQSHICISEYLETKYISEENIMKLKTIIG